MEADEMMDMPEPEFRRAVVTRLDKQDEAIANNTKVTEKVAEDTAFIRSAWTEGITAVRFFCRFAAAWRFLMKQVLVPMGLPALGLYGFWYYVEFHRFPAWLSDCFKFLMAVL
ncbi:hypothetical protein ACFSHT_16005 [Paraburkholderia silviterrae]|uniref:Uncharacterized protein n=1 Tax=Paraburkholderia silviterrae TaxID=2528715 RepID=A0A4R5M9K2_9BURK|nr:hypothetical protein [Paraburkholderia silviterrae]TDG23205.1 hypothetical protein EYW47_14830 [Paraburkholderia silviterrae]